MGLRSLAWPNQLLALIWVPPYVSLVFDKCTRKFAWRAKKPRHRHPCYNPNRHLLEGQSTLQNLFLCLQQIRLSGLFNNISGPLCAKRSGLQQGINDRQSLKSNTHRVEIEHPCPGTTKSIYTERWASSTSWAAQVLFANWKGLYSRGPIMGLLMIDWKSRNRWYQDAEMCS